MSLARYDLWENLDHPITPYPNNGQSDPQVHRPNADLVIARGDNTLSFVNCRDAPLGGLADGIEIATQSGKSRVENLMRGDLVQTVDNGLQPIRWVCQIPLPGDANTRLIDFYPGAIGNENHLLLSPLHHILVSGWRVELLFGAGQALVAAGDLVNETTIRAVQRKAASLTSILFDRHEIIIADGGHCESFFPTERNLLMLKAAQRDDLLAWFPELQWCTDTFGKTARQCLTSREAGMLLA